MIEAIITTFGDRQDFVSRCVTSMRERARRNDYHITVIGDGPNPSTAEWCRRGGVDYIEVGYGSCAKARNHGMRRVDAEYYVLADDDGYVATDGWLTKMIDAAESHPDVLLVGVDVINERSGRSEGYTPLVTMASPLWGTLGPRGEWGDRVVEVDHVSSALWPLKRRCLEVVGYLNEGFVGSAQTHDLIYTMRIRRRPYTYRVVYCGTVKFVHRAARRDTRMGENMALYDDLVYGRRPMNG